MSLIKWTECNNFPHLFLHQMLSICFGLSLSLPILNPVSHSSVKVAAGCFLLTVIACCWCSCWRDTFKPRETFPSRISTRFFLHTQTHIWRIHRSFNFITPSKNWVVDGTYQVTLQLSTCGENMKFDHWPLSLHLEKIGWQLLFTNIPGRCIL